MLLEIVEALEVTSAAMLAYELRPNAVESANVVVHVWFAQERAVTVRAFKLERDRETKWC